MRAKSKCGLIGLLVAMIALAAAMMLPQAASAKIAITSFDAEIENSSGDPETRAGVHPYKARNIIEIAPDPSMPNGLSDSVKDIIVDLPPGMIGNPTRLPTCTGEELLTHTCPIDAQMGYMTLNHGQGGFMLFPIYNMAPKAGLPAQFGAMALSLPIYLDAHVRPEDNGITIKSLATPTAVPLSSIQVEFWGIPADPSFDGQRGNNPFLTPNNLPPNSANTGMIPFLTTPTDCSQNPPVTRVRINGWSDPDYWVEEEFVHPQFEGCDRLDYRAELAVEPHNPSAGAPSGYTVVLDQQLSTGADSLATSDLRKAEVTLPEGVQINPAAGIGLQGCTPEQIGLGTDSEIKCPQASKIGEVTIETPMLKEKMKGAIYQAAPHNNPFNSLLALYMTPEAAGVQLKLAGEVSLDQETGQITTTFDDNPRLPFSKLTLNFKGGERAILKNPERCGTHQASGQFTPWSGNDPVAALTEIKIDGSCDRWNGFDPQLRAGSNSTRAGALSPFSIAITNGPGHRDLTGIQATLPKGLLGMVSSVPLCPDVAAASGSCAESSRIGSVQVGVGAGNQSLWVPEAGKDRTSIFLAGPYQGAPYSLSIVVPAQAGPLDLGTVVSRAPLHVDPETTQITTDVTESRVYRTNGGLAEVVDGGLPTRLQGIPLEIREIRVLMDRDGFMLNPTNCSAMTVDASLRSSGGDEQARSSRFQVGACANLGFAPRFGARILNKGRRSTLRSFHPQTRFTVVPRKGEANIGAARVVLPSSILLDQANIGTTCTRVQMAANDCPEASIVGHARAWSPLLQRPVQGPVYLAANGGVRPLPDLAAVMDGEIRVRLMGEISTLRRGRTARLQNTFRAVPDAPVSRFVLTMRGGAKRGLLVNSTDLCRTNERGVAVFRGQNGRTHRLRPRIATSFRGCAKVRRQVARRSMARQTAARKVIRKQSAAARGAIR